MNPMRIRMLTLASFLALTGALSAQPYRCLNRTLAVTVVSDRGQIVEGFTAQNFRGKVRGQSVESLSATFDRGPRRVVLLLDASGSMKDQWGVAVSGARGLFDAARESSFALLTFSTRVEVEASLTAGRDAVAAKLMALDSDYRRQPQGKTALFDALKASLDLLRPVRFGDAVYLASDGGENASKNKQDIPKVREVFEESGVRMFALIPTSSIFASARTPADEWGGPAVLQNMAKLTGGDSLTVSPENAFMPSVVTHTDAQTKSLATVGFANEIAGLYKLTVKLPAKLDKQQNWDLDVLDSDGKKNSHWRILYPHRLAACR